MKHCKYCSQDKADDQFSPRGKKLNNKCKACVVEYSKSHYQANKDVYVARAKTDAPAARQRWRDFIKTLNLSCTQCGEDHPAVLDFHHTDPSIKEDHPSNLRSSKQRFLKEIESCIVLCSNCHRKHHWENR